MSLFKGMLINNRILGAAVIAAALFTPAIASAATAYVSASVNVRSGPGSNYGRLAALPAGATVNAGSCRNGWCQIYNGSSVGWVSARYVRFGSYSGPAYAAPSSTTVIVNNDGYGDGFGLGLGLGWATGGYWGPGWGGGWGQAGAADRTTSTAVSGVTASPIVAAGITIGAAARRGMAVVDGADTDGPMARYVVTGVPVR